MNGDGGSVLLENQFGSPPLCANCDYRLDGLAAGMICPECGTVIPADLITLGGWRNPPMTTWGRGQATRAAQIAILLYLLLLSTSLCIAVIKGPAGNTKVAVLILLVGIAVIFALNIRLPAGRPPMRLRIAPSGYELRRGPGPFHLQSWQAAYPATIRTLGKGYWQLSIGWKDPMLRGGNALQFCSRGDAVAAKRLGQMIDSFTQSIKPSEPTVFPYMT